MKRLMVEVTCWRCGRTEAFEASSPAAPMLTACERAHKDKGWGFEVGFFAMMTGDHRPVCPQCLLTTTHHD